LNKLMPRYSYIAKSLDGKAHSDILEAKNERELAKILRKEGYILIKAESEEKKHKKKFAISISLFGKIKLVDKMMFARNLRVMVAAGVSFPRALKILAGQTQSKKFQKALSGISEEIVEGKSFSDALRKYPAIFSELFVSMVKVGEEAGTLEEVLEVLTDQMEKDHEIKSKIKGAMMYPLVIVLAMIIIGILMLIMVVPNLAQVFADLGIELPITTRIVIAIGIFLSKFWYLLPVIVFVLVFLVRISLKTKPGKLIIDALILKIPVASSIIKKTNSAYTARTLSSLINAGVPIVRSLKVVSETLGNIYYKEALLKAAKQVEKGNKLADALGQYEKIYPTLLIQMIEIGEETGETSHILEKLAEFYEEEVTNVTKNLSAVIEPVLMLIVGAVVGFFAISMIQPMYSMLESI